MITPGKPVTFRQRGKTRITGKGQGMTQFIKSGRRAWKATLMVSTLTLVLTGCQTGEGFNPFRANTTDTAPRTGADATSVRLVERDVEAPDVFQKTDMGLWDGRPSLGGVWVAHPDVREPERVIIRNTANSNFVIGALFRRERENPGPVFQVSSDAAAALGMLAGAPVQLNVTALRREEAPAPEAPTDDATEAVAAPEAVETSALDPVAGAAAAIEAADDTATTAAPTPSPQPAAPPRATASRLEKPFIQIGIFSVEENAENTATAMRQNGMVPTVMKQSSQGKTFWRVIVGPATSASERSVLLEKIKGVGFEDAYPVTN
jgi:cell division septation protein DedD